MHIEEDSELEVDELVQDSGRRFDRYGDRGRDRSASAIEERVYRRLENRIEKCSFAATQKLSSYEVLKSPPIPIRAATCPQFLYCRAVALAS